MTQETRHAMLRIVQSEQEPGETIYQTSARLLTQAALEASKKNVPDAAFLLGITPTSLYKRIRECHK